MSVALLLSISLRNVSVFSNRSKALSVLLIPIILGNVSSAFIWKLLLVDNQFFFLSSSIKFVILGFIQFWQYGTLFTYLFWLNQQTIPNDTWNYSNVSKLNLFEKVRDIILPKQRNLSLLLYVVGFIFCFYEDAKMQFIYRASRGTDTELVNQWLNRNYQSDTLINPVFAFQQIAQIGVIVMIIALVILVSTLFLKSFTYSLVMRSKTLPKLSLKPQRRLLFIILWGLFAFVLLPLLIALLKQALNLNFHLSLLLFPMLLTLIASLVSTTVAIGFGILSRMAWLKMLSDFNFRSMAFLIVLFIMLLIPPLVILISGFKWMQFVGYDSSNYIYLAWITGHTILSFPLLAGFAIATHFRVNNNHIDYLDSHTINLWEKVLDIFIMPFRADYLLVLILAFSTIWNESIVNNVLSDSIPSFVTELNKTISGKATDYSNGMQYLLVSLVLAILSVGIWNYIIAKNQQNAETK